jgi:tripartite-type tricarboxylate transporter receptor subunit TctC
MKDKLPGIFSKLVSIFVLFFSGLAWSAEVNFPAKPIHIWVGFAAGAASDVLNRRVGALLEKNLGQPVVVENKPGGSGAVCLTLLKSVNPDGYTLSGSTDTGLTRAPHLTKVNYDPIKDFIPVARLGLGRSGLAVKTDGSFKKYQDFIDYARKNPGKVTVSVGYGTSSHIMMEKIARREGIKFQYVYSSGAAESVTSLLGGHVMACSNATMMITPHVKEGSLKILLLYESEGADQARDIMTLEKVGYDFKCPFGELVVAPKEVPKPIMDKLSDAYARVMKTPEYLEVARQQELIISPLFGDELQKWVTSQHSMYGAAIKDLKRE